jgi:RimJ/RimL family protein N-acetyltransferase
MRSLVETDLEPLAAIFSDPEVTRFLTLGGVTQDRVESWRALALMVGHWALRGYGLWAIERREDGAFLGRVGLWRPEGWPGLEVGWALGRAHWGSGYAFEAAQAAMDWAWAELDAERLISVIHPGNVRSISVARRLGMTFERDWAIGEQPVQIYSRGR